MRFNGNALKAFRYRAGMTQEQVAKAVGRSVVSYRRWEVEGALPAFALVEKIAEFLGCEPDDLIIWEEPEPDAKATCGD